MITVENVGFSEALRAAWLLEQTRGHKITFCISRENGEKLYHGTNGYELTYKVNGRSGFNESWHILAPHVPAYWLESNDWKLTVEL